MLLEGDPVLPRGACGPRLRRAARSVQVEELEGRVRRGLCGAVLQSTDRDELPEAVDVVYTTRWQTTATVKDDARWRETFRPYYVDSGLLARWPQAAMKLSGALAVLQRAGRGGASARLCGMGFAGMVPDVGDAVEGSWR